MMRLNKNQLKAVKHVDGPLLVIAGAGTGKTSVIAHRIAHLIENKGINPGNILALTFSNKAAEEMKKRVEELLASSHDDIWISTFHSFCAEVLRENALELGISPFFRLVTEPEQLSLMVTNIERLDLRYYEVKGSPHGLLKQMLGLISRAKDEMITAEDYKQFAERLATSDGERDLNTLKISEVVRVYAAYQMLLLEHDCVDFGDLILYTIQGLKEKPHLLLQYQQRFQFILVDEFQDTNFAQSALLDMLAESHGNLCVVGDDDQSIYRFRGASIKNILDFKDRYPEATVITLDENYRSPQDILDAAHTLITHNSFRLDKRLKASSVSDLHPAEPIRHHSFVNVEGQAQYLAREIHDLLVKDETLTLSDIAVLIRSIKNQSRPITQALERAGIPYNLIGGSGFFERREIRDILSWMRAIDNPFDTENLVRAIHTSPFKVSPIHVSRISNWARCNGELTLFDALKEVDAVANMDKEAIGEVRSFYVALRDLIDRREELTAGEMVREIIDKIGYRGRLLQTGTRNFMVGLTNLKKLETMAEDYCSLEGHTSLRSFLRYLSYLMLSSEKPLDSHLFDAVNVMTIHQAKGLEFRIVFMTDLVQSKFPGSRRSPAIDLPDDLLKEKLPEASSREFHVSEERRLFYVGMTRAKERLYLFRVTRYNEEQREKKPSQFLTEALGERTETEYPLDTSDLLLKGTSPDVNLAKSILHLTREMEFKHDEKADFQLLLKRGLRSQIDLLKAHLMAERDIDQFECKLKMINQSIEALFPRDLSDDLLNTRLDEQLRAAFLDNGDRGTGPIAEEQESYSEFLPIADGGLDITFSALNTYSKCPLQFKYSYIYNIPPRASVNTRVGNLLHKVLEYFHKNYTMERATAEDLLGLFKDGWNRARLPDSVQWRQFKEKAISALTSYFDNFRLYNTTPVYFERPFTLRLGKHRVKGRVDRIDITTTGGYELIDYKTGRTWNQREVNRDLQLSVYALGAMEAWGIKPEVASYYFLIENKRLSITHEDQQLEEAKEKIVDLADNILAENFEPTPDYQNCRYCDYRSLCGEGEMI